MLLEPPEPPAPSEKIVVEPTVVVPVVEPAELVSKLSIAEVVIADEDPPKPEPEPEPY